MLEQIHRRTGEYPDEALVDGGFASKAEIEQCAEREVILYAPVAKPKGGTRPMCQDSCHLTEIVLCEEGNGERR
jgi:hypothetical protein